MLWLATLTIATLAAIPQWLTIPSTSHPIQNAKWIWPQLAGQLAPTSHNGAKGTFEFARTFTAQRGARATLWFTADNHAEVTLNGKRLAESSDWSHVATVDLTPALKEGTNELQIRATNTNTVDPNAVNPGGLIAALTVSERSKTTTILTDRTWKCAQGTVQELGPANVDPWNLSFPDGPCPIFRRQFQVSTVPKRAPIRIVGLGHFQLFVNGHQVGRAAIHQPWSQFNKTIYSESFDIAKYLKRGENVLAVMLGNSFYRVSRTPEGRWVKDDAMPDFSQGRPYLLWVDATIGRQKVTTDTKWRWTQGPVVYSHIYAGEEFDARQSPKGWQTPGFNDEKWSAPVVTSAPTAQIVPESWPAFEAAQIFRPTQIERAPNGSYSYRFAQNCSAMLRYTIKGKPGQRVEFHLSEVINPNGTVEQLNLWGRQSLSAYTLATSTSETHQDLFFYHGGQFVGVYGAVPKGQPNPQNLPVIESLELVHVRTNNPEASAFKSSSDLLNKTHNLIDWAMRSNMSFVLTDCPHREKLGWLECAHLLTDSFAYRYDCKAWFHKVCRDLRDAQLPSGRVLTVAPVYLMRPEDDMYAWTVEWGAASVLLPYQAYQWYGDRTFLTENYSMMKRFVDHIETQAKDGIAPASLGDWYDYGHGKGPGPSRFTPQDLTATAVWAMCTQAVIETAKALHDPTAQAKYEELFATIKADFNQHFYDPTTHTFVNNGSVQTGSTIALAANLVLSADRSAVLEKVIDELKTRDFQQTPGDVGHLFFIRALAQAGRSDILERVYSRTGTGSYGGILAKGLTTLPETWDAITVGSNSLNHCMLGHAMEWLYGYALGIRQKPGSVGWQSVIIDPQVRQLASCSGHVDTPKGRIMVAWKRTSGHIKASITIPPKMSATLANGVKLHSGQQTCELN